MRVWCNTCHRMREVTDVYFTDEGDRFGTKVSDRKDRVACPLECGHDAGDGGGPPFRSETDRRREQGLVSRVAQLQEGARER